MIFFVSTASAAEVTFFPSGKTVSQGESFDLNVTIDPMGNSIAGVQMELEFNGSLIHINDIIEGDLLKKNGTGTSFNRGLINNSLGTVINIYNAILGPYNISAPGKFIIINITAAGSQGKSWINLSNVKICDPEGNYAAVNVINGSININRITSDMNPPASVENLKNISYAREYINWTWTDPSDTDFAGVMVYLNGIYQKDVLKGLQYYNASLAPGTYTIGTRTVDINGNINSSMVMHTATTLLPAVRFINGTVLDSITKTGITGVKVTTNTGISTTTDESGSYSLAVNEGTYELIGALEPEYYPNSMSITTSFSVAVLQNIELVKKPTGNISGSVKIS